MIKLKVVSPSAKLINIKKLVQERKAQEMGKYPICYYVIEHVGRICYNSYDPTKTLNDMVEFIIGAASRGHRSIFEFGALRFIYMCENKEISQIYNFLFDNRSFVDVKFAHLEEGMGAVTITGSPRAFIEILENLTTEEHNPCIDFFYALYRQLDSLIPIILRNWETFESINNQRLLIDSLGKSNTARLIDITDDYTDKSKFTKFLFFIQCDRSVSHELVRHRPISVLQASQRYIRYNEDNPYLICMGKGQQKDQDFVDQIQQQAAIAFNLYTELLNNKVKPENARLVLPNVTETKVFLYATLKEYQHIFRMRQAKVAYPPIKEVVDDVYQQLIDKKYI